MACLALAVIAPGSSCACLLDLIGLRRVWNRAAAALAAVGFVVGDSLRLMTDIGCSGLTLGLERMAAGVRMSGSKIGRVLVVGVHFGSRCCRRRWGLYSYCPPCQSSRRHHWVACCLPLDLAGTVDPSSSHARASAAEAKRGVGCRFWVYIRLYRNSPRGVCAVQIEGLRSRLQRPWEYVVKRESVGVKL